MRAYQFNRRCLEIILADDSRKLLYNICIFVNINFKRLRQERSPVHRYRHNIHSRFDKLRWFAGDHSGTSVCAHTRAWWVVKGRNLAAEFDDDSRRIPKPAAVNFELAKRSLRPSSRSDLVVT